MSRVRSENGAAAVEFALLLPLLLFIVFALVDLGWIFNQQLALTSAAREGVRHYAIHHADPDTTPAAVMDVAEGNAAALVPLPDTLEFDWVECDGAPDAEASLTVSKPVNDLTGLVSALATGLNLSATGTMRCGG
jgi:hypothetical protein